MRKIKTDKKPQSKAPMSDSIKIFLYSLAGIALLIIIVLLVLEGRSSNITVKNNSGVKLEYVKAYFVDMEGPVTEKQMLFEDLGKGDIIKNPLEKIDLSYRQANLEIRFKFEGYDELFVDSGYFNEVFKGRLSIEFKDTDDGKVVLKVKGNNGVLPSRNLDCNEEHIINLAEGYVED